MNISGDEVILICIFAAVLVSLGMIVFLVERTEKEQEATRQHVSNSIGTTAHQAELAKNAAYDTRDAVERMESKCSPSSHNTDSPPK